MKERECPSCQGSGIDPDLGTDARPEVRCRTCNGHGVVETDKCHFCEEIFPERNIGRDGLCRDCRTNLGAMS